MQNPHVDFCTLKAFFVSSSGFFEGEGQLREVPPGGFASWGTSNFYRLQNLKKLSVQGLIFCPATGTFCKFFLWRWEFESPNCRYIEFHRQNRAQVAFQDFFSCEIFPCNIFFMQDFFHVTNLLFRIIQTFSFIERLTLFLLIWYILQSVFLFLSIFCSFWKSTVFKKFNLYCRKFSPHEIPHLPDLSHFTRFVNKTRFVNTFLRNENVTNRRMHFI